MDEREVTNTILVNGKVLVAQQGEQFAEVLIDYVQKQLRTFMEDKSRDVHLSQVCNDNGDTQMIVLYATK